MKRADTVVIGGGQAGLAMSWQLGARGIDHVILERGRVAERWRSERWDSLRLLTPRWQSRLPGRHYRGPDPDGFMTRAEVIAYLDDYARSFAAPVEAGVTVEAVDRDPAGWRVRTGTGTWRAPNVVIATGYCDRPSVPTIAASIAPDIAQVVPSRYRNPADVAPGGVLVVGASATGVQLAAELAAAGRSVSLAVGRHIRIPRRYRGRDIMAWLDAMGVLAQTVDEVPDVAASRRQPSLQLIGRDDARSLDLAILQAQGVRLVGHIAGGEGRRLTLAPDLATSIGHAERKMHEVLDRVDRFIERTGLGAAAPAEARPRPVRVPDPPAAIDLGAEGIRTVVWATGYRRAYPWLHAPVLNARGELRHEGGVTAEPGLYALGLHFMRRRNSSFLDGVGADAADLADHIAARMARRRGAAA